ncbi:MAG: M28 family peptidase [Acidobacteriota bacterium]|nr:M28 family peptidase [Acidobacteriota bacterium]
MILLSLAVSGCPKNDNRPNAARISVSERASHEKNPAVVPGAVSFNGERAMDHVRKQIEIGPRVSGSKELAKTREYIMKALVDVGLKVTTDEFLAPTPVGTKTMVNMTAEIPGESKDVIILSSHYETKFFKDMLFVGANDPASSVATLLEIARVISASQQKLKFTYWLVFFDGEESFCEEWDECSKPDAPDNTYGSRHYVSKLRQGNQLDRVRAMILLDLMGYKNLNLGRDTLSTKWLQDIVWKTGRDLGHGKVFVDRPEGVGGDDHEPFLRAGVDALDIIQLNSYPYWHKADDTVDKVSSQSMKVVGDVVIASLPRIEEYLQKRKR